MVGPMFLMVDVEPVGFDCFWEAPDFAIVVEYDFWRTCRKCFSKEEEDEDCHLAFRKHKSFLRRNGGIIPPDFKMVFKREKYFDNCENPKVFTIWINLVKNIWGTWRSLNEGLGALNEIDDDGLKHGVNYV